MVYDSFFPDRSPKHCDPAQYQPPLPLFTTRHYSRFRSKLTGMLNNSMLFSVHSRSTLLSRTKSLKRAARTMMACRLLRMFTERRYGWPGRTTRLDRIRYRLKCRQEARRVRKACTKLEKMR